MLRALRSSSRVQFTVRHSLLLRFVTCWKCGTDLVHEDFFCASNSCGVVQPVKLNNVNAFQLFHLEQRYFIDTNALEIEYKSVQKLLHPDMFASKPNDERDASNETSSTVNQAYQILRSPICRAEYMLKIQFGIDAFEEGRTLSAADNNALMMEVFEVREQISETDNAADLMRLQTNIREDIVQIEKAFAGSLEGNNQTRALHYAVRLKYYSKMLEEIEERLPPSH